MTATDRLRAMLDEREVEWEALPDQQDGDFTITATRWHDGEGGLLTMFISEPHGSTWDFFWLPTPEQAIAATLGTGQAADEWGDGFRAGCDAANKASEESVEHYKAENDKLRKMNEAMWLIIRCAIGEISAKDGLPVIHEDDLIMLRNMRRDLGIEVGE